MNFAENKAGAALTVTLMDSSPLWVCICAIRKCWKSEGDADSFFAPRWMLGQPPHHFSQADLNLLLGIEDYTKAMFYGYAFDLGEKDEDLLHKVIKHGHESTVEHIKYSFEIKNISRAILQELARHRIASLSVESSRYVLKRLLKNADETTLRAILVSSGDEDLDRLNIKHMMAVAELGRAKGLTNDVLKYGIPEAFKTELVWTVNARSLRNFLKLRASKRAHFEIRRLASAIYEALPEDHRKVFDGCLPEPRQAA